MQLSQTPQSHEEWLNSLSSAIKTLKEVLVQTHASVSEGNMSVLVVYVAFIVDEDAFLLVIKVL